MNQKDNLFYSFLEKNNSKLLSRINDTIKSIESNKDLIWESFEGYDVKPLYHKKNTNPKISLKKNFPDCWYVGHILTVKNWRGIESKIKELLDRGVESITLKLDTDKIEIKKFESLLNFGAKKFLLEINPKLKLVWLDDFFSLINSRSDLSINFDPFSSFASSGEWNFSEKKDIDHWNKLQLNFKEFNRIYVDGRIYQNSGASIAEQIAFLLSHAIEYLSVLDKKSEKSKKTICFYISLGSNFFFEISKIKALRILWDLISREIAAKINCEIIVQPSNRNMTLYDYNINFLRTSTSCMSGIIGGANVINNLPYDSVYNSSNDFANRLAVNQLLIFKHEAGFEKLENPASGSYYLEELTFEIIQKSLLIFKEIERKGGFLKNLKSNYIQDKIASSANKEQILFDKNDHVLVGINKFQNLNEKAISKIAKSCENDFVKEKNKIRESRLSEKIENDRIENENK